MTEIVGGSHRENVKESLRERRRSSEILAVFARHNFYVNGFTPDELRTTLEDLGPTYVKIGQIMSSRTDLLPEAYCRELEKLRSNVAPLDSSVVKSIIEDEAGRPVEELYAEFDDEPLGSASIAQAHYGVLMDGTRVVTKVQRPHIADMMRKDFVLLNKLAGFVSAVDEGDSGGSVNLASVLAELEKVTEDELDFRVEANNTRLFGEQCVDADSGVSCPTIIDSLTTERILTMSFVDGYSIADRDRVEADGYDCVEIGRAIVGNYLHQVLDVGMFHGDPHQGNIMLSHGVPYWIDFGMVGHISDAAIGLVQQIVFSVVRKDPEALADAALALGKKAGSVDKARLTDDLDGLIGRYASAKDLTSIDLGALMTELTDIMAAHRLSMPGEYTMLVRGLVTMEGVVEQFCPELNLFDFVAEKMLARARESFDARSQIEEALEDVASVGAKTAHVPLLAYEALRNLVKGRTKVGVELAGYDKIVGSLRSVLVNVLLALFACVLFSGSCTLCTTGMQPQSNGVPLVALIGFVVSVALAVFSIRNLVRGT